MKLDLANPVFPAVIDNSMRKEFVKCEMSAHFKYERGLRSVAEQRVDLHAGKAFARGMEVMRKAYYGPAKMTAYESLQEGIKALYQEYGSFIPPLKSNKTADRMAGALAFYAEHNPLDQENLVPVTLNGMLGVEVGFDFEIPRAHPDSGEPLRYCGRFDMLAQDKRDGSYWVVDEKTTSQMGDKWANQWLLDSQMTGYCWGAQLLLHQHGRFANVEGAVINGIAIRLRDYEHGRFTAYRQGWEIDRWYRQMLADVDRWKGAYLSGQHNQNLDHACAQYNNPCEYSTLCKAANPERLIDGSYVVKFWNPLTREETTS